MIGNLRLIIIFFFNGSIISLYCNCKLCEFVELSVSFDIEKLQYLWAFTLLNAVLEK